MFREDADVFRALMEDLCVAYDRPITDAKVRVYWETLKHLHIADVKRSAEAAKRSLKKMPSPAELMPEKRYSPQATVVAPEPLLSPWAIAANKILFVVAYQGHRGFKPMGDKLPNILKVKADYVRMAEEAEANGDTWNHEEFNRMCREGFEKLLRIAA